jgi:hypothetical protein
MRTTRMNKLGLVGAILLAALVAGAAPAQAATTSGTASLGSIAFTKGNQPQVSVASLAPCSVAGTTTASSGPVVKTGVTLGGGTTSCTITTANGAKTSHSVATGKDFVLTVLKTAPAIKMKTYGATCTGSSTGTSAGWSFGGLSGLTGLPAQVPSGYVYQVKDGSSVLAEITFGEFVVPNPADGSIAMNTLHIRFKPASKITGEIILGAAACTPVQ